MLKAVEASRREGKFEDAGDRLLTQAENLALDSAANVQVQLRENPSRVFYGSDRLRPNVRTQAQSQSFSACPIFSSASISSGLGSESLNSAGSDATNFVV